LLKILSIALKLWIKSKCQTLEQLQIKLTGSTIDLLKGRLKGADLYAYKVVLMNMHINQAKLESGPLTIDINLRNQEQKINLTQPFKVKGQLLLDEQGINQTLLSQQWRWIGSSLSSKLLDTKNFECIKVCKDKIEIHALSENLKTQLKGTYFILHSKGTLIFQAVDGSSQAILPMDTSIKIKDTKTTDKNIILYIEAEVTP